MSGGTKQAASGSTISGRRIDQAMLEKLHTLHQRYVKTLPHGRRVLMRSCDLSGLNMNGFDFSVAEFVACDFTRVTARGWESCRAPACRP